MSSMQLLTFLSLKVFESDGMPRKVCETCKVILGNAYKFKQICKRSDTLLKMFPMTGVVPPRIKIPQAMLPPRAPEIKPQAKPETKTVGVGCDELDAKTEVKESATQTEPEAKPEEEVHEIDQMEMVIEEEIAETVIAPPAQFSEVEEEDNLLEIEEDPPKTTRIARKPADSVKILNKSRPATSSPPKQFKKPSQIKIERVDYSKPKILNSQVLVSKREETIIDSIETTADGNVQIVSFNEEYLDENDWDVKTKTEPLDKSDDGIVYTCNVCERSFPLLQQLEIHKKNHDRERNHPCQDCDKSFFTKYDLAKHVLTHTKQKDYTCVVCKKSFSRSTLLYRHEKIHTDPNIPRYSCEDCDRVYLNKLDYEKHSVTHTKNRPFACDVCDKRFAFKQGLERHQTIHDNESQPHPCMYCEMRFPSAARLQRHLSNDHAGTRPFPCSKCSKRFMLSHHLYRHMRTSHNTQDDIESYQCPECEEVHTDREEFFTHCNEHGEYTLNCPLCKVNFESSDDVADHIFLHSKSDMYYCDYCNLIYMSQEHLNDHFLDQHSNELCSVGEEVEFVVEEDVKTVASSNKRKHELVDRKPVSKKSKNTEVISYDLEEIEEEQFEFLSEDQYVVSSDIGGAAFVEYEEANPTFDQPKSSRSSTVKKALSDEVKRKTYTRSSRDTSQKPAVDPKIKQQTKSSPVIVERVKMSQAKIEQLKKEGKIKIVNGEMLMKS